MDNHKQPAEPRKLYELVLGQGIGLEVKKEAVLSIIKLALADHSHFSFLLNQVNWFCQSNLSLMPLLAKVLRAYRGTSKTAPKVVANLIAEGLSIPIINMSVVDVLADVLTSKQDSTIMIQALKENYPHKVCPLETHVAYVESLLELIQRAPVHRFQILELIIETLTSFDTEMILGEEESLKIACPDEEVLALEEQCGILESKFDQILWRVINFMSRFDCKGKDTLLKEVFLIFQKIIMAVDNTKMIQCLVFYLAQSSPQQSSSFLALLLVTIIENYSNKTSKRKFIVSLQYLRCYLTKSITVTPKSIKKVFSSLSAQLSSHLQNLEALPFEKVNLNQFGEQNTFNLYILETILFINWKFPTLLNNEASIKSFQKLLQDSQEKLHFTTFIDPALLKALDISELLTCDNAKNGAFKTKCIQKFLPVFLPKTRSLIKMKEVVSVKRKRPNWTLDESTEVIRNAPCKKLFNSNSSGSFTPLNDEGIEV